MVTLDKPRIYSYITNLLHKVPKADALKGKLQEFNSKAPESLQLKEGDIDKLLSLGKFLIHYSFILSELVKVNLSTS